MESGDPSQRQPAVARATRRPRQTQAERRATAERKLLTAAVKLIAEKGVSRTTLGEIGEAAGYSRTLPAVYFRDRAGLVRAVWDYVSSLFFRRMQDAGGRRNGLDVVLGFVEVYLTRSGKDPVFLRATQVLLAEALTATPEIQHGVAIHNRETEKFLRKHIRLGQEAGEIRRDVDAKIQAVLIIGALRGVISHWVIDPSINLVAIRKEFVESLRRSLAAGPDK
jgi:AcrR family transcriptional regulator